MNRAWVTSAGSRPNSELMSGNATAIIVEFSGINVAASEAATRRTPARLAGTVSDTGDRASLQQEELAAPEGELDVVVGRAEHLVAA